MGKNKKNKGKAQNNKQPTEKKSLKELLQKGDIEIPICVRNNINRIYIVAGVVLLIGIILSVMSFDLFVAISTVVLAFGISGLAYYREIRLSNEGYIVIEGQCEKVEYTIRSQAISNVTNGITKDVPKRFIITTEDGAIAIPYYKNNIVIEEGDTVRLYVGHNTKFLEVRGVYTPDSMLGYEIVY